MNCQFCYSKKQRVTNELPLKAWKNFFLSNKDKISDINYGTGENTLSETWLKLIKIIRSNAPNIKQALTTNGSLMLIKDNKARQDIIDSIDEIDVSLDFGNKEKHNSFRGNKKAFDMAIGTLKFCQKYNIQSTIVILGIEKTLTKTNLSGIFKIAKKYRALVRINLYRPANEKCTIKPPKLNTIITVFDWINQNQTICSISDPIFSSIMTQGITRHDPSANNSIRILHDGYIFPSTYLIRERYKTFSIFEKNVLTKVARTKIFQDIRKSSIPSACRSCSQKNRCQGGVIDRRYLCLIRNCKVLSLSTIKNIIILFKYYYINDWGCANFGIINAPDT